MAEPWLYGPRPTDSPGRYIPIAIRRAVLARDGYLCRYCGEPATDIDHVWPWALYGSHDLTNLVASCELCNSIAGIKPFSEFVRKRLYILDERLKRELRLAREATSGT